MRRFVEEIKVTDPQIAEKIVVALETRSYDASDPVYEVDMFEGTSYDPISNKNVIERSCHVLKIFAREELAK